MSHLLFASAIELLVFAVCVSGHVEGVCRGGIEHRISLYADDLLFVSNPLTSVPAVLKIFDGFGKLSGYKVNLNKSELFLINEKAQGQDFENFPLKVVTDHFIWSLYHRSLHQEENLTTCLNIIFAHLISVSKY